MREKCKLHPLYKAGLPPRSKKPECTCLEIWNKKNA